MGAGAYAGPDLSHVGARGILAPLTKVAAVIVVAIMVVTFMLMGVLVTDGSGCNT